MIELMVIGTFVLVLVYYFVIKPYREMMTLDILEGEKNEQV